MNTNRVVFPLLLLGTSVLLSGCVTHAVWDTGQFARYHEPAQPLDLHLARSSQSEDVLVQYTERREGDQHLRTRAYWLEPNDERIEQGHKPRFTSDNPSGLVQIPIATSRASLPGPPVDGIYAIAATNYNFFTLYSTREKSVAPDANDKEVGSYKLPVYQDASGRVKQVLLTPPAVVADATIVGGAVAIWLAPAFWTSLNCWVGK